MKEKEERSPAVVAAAAAVARGGLWREGGGERVFSAMFVRDGKGGGIMWGVGATL